MSECVVRMKMPNSCYECEMRGAWAFCPIGKWPVVGYKKQRHEDCPVICQLPEGHGRLIDADALIDVLGILGDKGGNPVVWKQMRYIAEDMTTIVPAERSET